MSTKFAAKKAQSVWIEWAESVAFNSDVESHGFGPLYPDRLCFFGSEFRAHLNLLTAEAVASSIRLWYCFYPASESALVYIIGNGAPKISVGEGMNRKCSARKHLDCSEFGESLPGD